MSTTLIFSNTNDSYTAKSSTNYTTASTSPASLVASSTDAVIFTGQEYSSGIYHVWQAFLQFAYTANSDETVVASELQLYSYAITGTGIARDLYVLPYDFGTSVDTSDMRSPWVLGSYITSPGLRAVWHNAHKAGTSRMAVGVREIDEFDSSSTIRYVLATSRNRFGNIPNSSEYHGIRSSDSSGTSQDPTLIVTSITQSKLCRTLAAQVQLSDGTHVYVEQGSLTGDTTLNFYHHDGTTATLFYAPSVTNRPTWRGAQVCSLVADASDNLYFIDQAAERNTLNCRALKKGSGHSWTPLPAHKLVLPDDRGDINNVVAAWHPAGLGGSIVVITQRNYALVTGGNMDACAIVDAGHLLGLNSPNNPTARFIGAAGLIPLTARPTPNGYGNQINPTGTLMDICAAPNSNRGFVICTERSQATGTNGAQSIARYEINQTGTNFVYAHSFMDTSRNFAVRDANAKSRVIPISDSQFVTVTASSASGQGITVVHRQNIDSSPTFNVLSTAFLDDEDLTTMPSASTLASANNWDAFYNEVDNRIWVYYFDTADNRRLMRTNIDLSTGEAGQIEYEVDDSVGASGSTNHAIRVHRGKKNGDNVLVSIANETSDGTHSMIYVNDYISTEPTQPILNDRTNFSAASSASFSWTFTHPNVNETQSAYELKIDNVTDAVTAYNSGKVSSGTSSHILPASSIANGKTYNWYVRTYDSQDNVSPWSEAGSFITSASGTLTITSPTMDNDPDINTAEYLFTWNVTGATQAAYRVVATRTDTGTTLVNTGWVTSTNTSYLLQNMLSDVEYSVQITARNSSSVETAPATRLITPYYNAPEKPIITVEEFPENGYILVSVENPEPRGDRPNPEANEIYRRKRDSSEPFILVGTTEANGSLRDYTAASGTLYEYFARAGVYS